MPNRARRRNQSSRPADVHAAAPSHACIENRPTVIPASVRWSPPALGSGVQDRRRRTEPRRRRRRTSTSPRRPPCRPCRRRSPTRRRRPRMPERRAKQGQSVARWKMLRAARVRADSSNSGCRIRTPARIASQARSHSASAHASFADGLISRQRRCWRAVTSGATPIEADVIPRNLQPSSSVCHWGRSRHSRFSPLVIATMRSCFKSSGPFTAIVSAGQASRAACQIAWRHRLASSTARFIAFTQPGTTRT